MVDYTPGSTSGVPSNVFLNDTFTGLADGALAGRIPIAGPAWIVTGPQGVALSGGYAASTGIGYMYVPGNPDVLACDVAWGGSAAGGAMTMAWSSSATFDVLNLVHFNFGPTTFNFTIRRDGGTFDTVFSGAWARPMKIDGTVYHVVVALIDDRLVVVGPSGESFASPVDARIPTTRGNWVFWEPNNTGGSSAKLRSVAAYSYAGLVDSFARPSMLASNVGYAPDGYSGAPYRRSRVKIGNTPIGMPGVTFGPSVVDTRLVGAHASGATSIITETPIPLGSTVQLESGSNSESVVTNGAPTGSGPYTSTCTGTPLTKNHADGSAAVTTALAAAASAYEYLNTEAGYFYLPNAVIVVLQSPLYHSANLTTFTQEAASGVLQVGGTGSGKGSIKTGQGATGARPTPAQATAGGQWFDTTLNKPIWSDGTNWRDAGGTIV